MDKQKDNQSVSDDENAMNCAAAHLYPRILKQDLSSFIARSFMTVDPNTKFLANWHIDAVSEYLEATRRSDITRLLINMPPRSLKSVCVSVAWPAWLLGHDPSMRIMTASYAQGLSLKHAQDTRLLVTSSWYRRLFPEFRIAKGQNEKHKFMTTKQGFRFATSVGGVATGEGGDVLIVDDPLNPLQAASSTERAHASKWFDQTFSTRLNDKENGRIVVVMQRLHGEDLSGHLLGKGDWEHLCLPAVAEVRTVIDVGSFQYVREVGDMLHADREGEKLLARARRDLGGFGFAAQYQQNPLAEEGGMISPQWIVRYERMPESFERIVQSWDTAIKAGSAHDASACVTVGERDGKHYVMDVLTIKAEYPELKRTVLEHAERYDPNVILIEDKASGQSLLQDMRRESAWPVIARMPRRDKVTRLASVSPFIEAGNLLLPRHGAWLAGFEEELFGFPRVVHDDQVDALSQYLGWIREQSGGGDAMRMRWL